MMPDKSDNLFGMVVSDNAMPLIVGILFIIGLIAAAYSAAGSALTSLTTSFTVDILNAHRRQDDKALTRTRKLTHLTMSAIMGAIIIVFWYLSEEDAISAVYTLASYTYGPILGLFVFGMFGRRPVKDIWVPLACILAPVLSWGTQWALKNFIGYETSFELLLINAMYTIIGLLLLSSKPLPQQVK